ncbi:hypothetical protein JB92DRAFT_3099184 [Gautieria morchelliformis]|nr:hypothetical protein JB92DRAFT_3099184 [Gautieria morchelliformis]
MCSARTTIQSCCIRNMVLSLLATSPRRFSRADATEAFALYSIIVCRASITYFAKFTGLWCRGALTPADYPAMRARDRSLIYGRSSAGAGRIFKTPSRDAARTALVWPIWGHTSVGWDAARGSGPHQRRVGRRRAASIPHDAGGQSGPAPASGGTPSRSLQPARRWDAGAQLPSCTTAHSSARDGGRSADTHVCDGVPGCQSFLVQNLHALRTPRLSRSRHLVSAHAHAYGSKCYSSGKGTYKHQQNGPLGVLLVFMEPLQCARSRSRQAMLPNDATLTALSPERALTEANNGGRDPSRLEQPIEAESASIVSSQAPAKRELYRGQLGQRHDMGGPEIHQSQFSLIKNRNAWKPEAIYILFRGLCICGPKLSRVLRATSLWAVAAAYAIHGELSGLACVAPRLRFHDWNSRSNTTMPLKYGTAAAFTKIYVSLFSSKRRFSNVTACDARRQEVEVSQLGEEREDGHERVQATGVLPLMLGTLHDPQRDEHGLHTHTKGRQVEEHEELPIECDLGVHEAIARGHADGQRDMVREAAMLVEAHVPALHCIVRSSGE